MALGSLSSAKINKKILFFQGKAFFYLFIISNIFAHHITIHGMNAFIIKVGGFLCPQTIYLFPVRIYYSWRLSECSRQDIQVPYRLNVF